jgi:uncharacterized sulfatase
MRHQFLFALVTLSTCPVLARGEMNVPSSQRRFPNVLFIVIDDLGHLNPGGRGPIRTPHLDRLASRGAVFERAFCQYPLCNPSRVSFLSGRRPDSTQVFDNNTHPRSTMPRARFLPEYFADRGYQTARMGKIAHNNFEDSVSWGQAHSVPIFSKESERLFHQRWVDGERRQPLRDCVFVELMRAHARETIVQGFSSGRLTTAPKGWSPIETYWYMGTTHYHVCAGKGEAEPDHQTARHVAQWLATPRDRPFFLGVGLYRPHMPWVAPRQFYDMYPIENIALPAKKQTDVPQIALSPQGRMESNPQGEFESRAAIQAYYASVSFADSQVGLILEALERSPHADNTIVVLMSDHGYHLGEHGLWHKLSLFEDALRVPLIITVPGISSGRRVREIVELIDVYPTIVDLAGQPVPDDLEGRSLAGLLRGEESRGPGVAWSVVRRGGNVFGKSIRTEQFRYTEWGGPSVAELYDHDVDPHELNNLVDQADYGPVLRSLRQLMRSGEPSGVTNVRPRRIRSPDR